MSSFIVKFKNTSDEEGTVIPDVAFNYSDKLNVINEASIKMSGTGEVKRTLLEVGSQVHIYRNGTLEFHGLTDSIDYLEGGAISIHASGYEVWLAKENGDYSSSPYTSTASATILGDIIGESNYFTAGTVETGTDIDFRAEVTDSLWNAISNLREKTQQDIGIDYVNTEIDVLDHKGSSTSVATFNAGITIGNIRVSQSYPLGNDVRVYGKGDGANQIKSDHTSHGQDSGGGSSQETYGIIRKIVRDPSVISEDEANKLADALVAIYKDPIKIYDFEVLNPNQSLVCGDVITLNARAQGLTEEEVRIVGIEKGSRGGQEYLTLQVTNKEYGRLVKKRNEILADIEKNARDQQTYMQGTTNILTFPEMINANNTSPLKVLADFPTSFIYDEAGNRRVNSFTLDYDVDEFRKTVGTASEDNVAPDVSGSSANTQPAVSGDSGSTAPGVGGTSSTTQPGVSGTSAETTYGGSLGSNSDSNVDCSSGSWTVVCVVSTTGNDKTVYADFYIDGVSGGAEDISIRLRNTGIMTYKNAEWESYYSDFENDSYICAGPLKVGTNGSNDVIYLEVYAHSLGTMRVNGYLSCYYVTHSHGDGSYYSNNHSHGDGSYAAANHDHGDGSYMAANHLHTDGTFGAASHNHSVSVGDAVSDAGSVNASQVSIYVDWWNAGTSNWDNKHSILNTGKTLDTDVDISDSDTLPDAAGFWRVRIITDNATPDLVQGIIKIKHQLDT